MKWFSQKKLQKRKKPIFPKAPQSTLYDQNLMISKDYMENEQRFRMVFQNCTDVIYRILQITKEQQGFIIYVDGLVDTRLLDLAIIKPLLYDSQAVMGKTIKSSVSCKKTISQTPVLKVKRTSTKLSSTS